jgi:hypothetical protein
MAFRVALIALILLSGCAMRVEEPTPLASATKKMGLIFSEDFAISEQETIAKCMKLQGFDYKRQEPQPRVHFDFLTHLDLDRLVQLGYRDFEAPVPTIPVNDRADDAETIAYQTALYGAPLNLRPEVIKGCQGQSRTPQDYSTTETDAIRDLFGSEEWSKVVRSWRTCLESEGYKVNSEQDLIAIFENLADPRVPYSSEQRALARKDAECRKPVVALIAKL